MIDLPPAAVILAIGDRFACHAAAVQHDGDNLRCAGIAQVLRMHAIDAPEVAGSYACAGDKARWHDCDAAAGDRARLGWQRIVGGTTLACTVTGDARYHRLAVACRLPGGRDPECVMVGLGLATARYAPLPGCRRA